MFYNKTVLVYCFLVLFFLSNLMNLSEDVRFCRAIMKVQFNQTLCLRIASQSQRVVKLNQSLKIKINNKKVECISVINGIAKSSSNLF